VITSDFPGLLWRKGGRPVNLPSGKESLILDRRKIKKRGIYIIPSLITSANVFCGFYALLSTYYDHFYQAAVAILLAIIIDGLDGRVARLTNACTDFGVEFDSLADFITFGVAPGVLIYTWALKPLGRIGILATFLFVICGALRLARFNTHFSEIKLRDFVGLPIPAAAGFLASLPILYRAFSGPDQQIRIIASLLSVYLLAFLMVSNIKYRSFKHLKLWKRKPFGLLVVLLLAILVIGSLPHIMIFSLLLSYIMSGPVESLVILYGRKGRSRAGMVKKVTFRR